MPAGYEKERDVKNIVFDPHQLFDSCQNIKDPRHQATHAKSSTGTIFLTHTNILGTHNTHATEAIIWLTPPTNPCTHATHPIQQTSFHKYCRVYKNDIEFRTKRKPIKDRKEAERNKRERKSTEKKQKDEKLVFQEHR